MNYLQKHKEQISNIKSKKTLLLHVCCGVCSVYPLLYLRKYFNIIIYFSNSNIYPYEEYTKRLDALNTYLNKLNDNTIKLIVPNYNNEEFTKDLTPYKDQKEGQQRCYICYKKRMEEAYEFANTNKFDYFTTVMSISNRKKADYINEIGEELQRKYPNTIYLYADFKKDNGIIENDKLNKKLDLYHQDYCGCIYSINNRTSSYKQE